MVCLFFATLPSKLHVVLLPYDANSTLHEVKGEYACTERNAFCVHWSLHKEELHFAKEKNKPHFDNHLQGDEIGEGKNLGNHDSFLKCPLFIQAACGRC